MKLLVLAQTPPPLHGQSLMVRTLVMGLPAQGIEVHHVNLALSRDAADIGRWRPGKVLAVLDACLHAVTARFRHGCDTLYYIPAPGKRGALYRDWAVMLLCRPFFKRLVLHWHAAGLADWLAMRAADWERGVTRLLLGRADLSIILTPSLRTDASALSPRRIVAMANGIADPGAASRAAGAKPFQIFFLGLGSEEKGLFTAADAVLKANAAAGGPVFTLVAAGSFPDAATAARFGMLCAAHPGVLRHVGPVEGEAKTRLFRESHCLCLPSRYPAEGQPLVLLEAMAADLPVVASRWAGIPETLPANSPLVAPGDAAALAAAFAELRRQPPAAGELRAHYLRHFTIEAHLTALAEALRSL